MNQTTKDKLWAEAKQKCKLNEATLKKAKAMGLNPLSLIKNIPSDKQRWKAPVSVWINEMYDERQAKAAHKAKLKSEKAAKSVSDVPKETVKVKTDEN